jgi:hypothetical protein
MDQILAYKLLQLANSSDLWTIDPSWLLSIVAGVAGFLIWDQIKGIKQSIRDLVKKIDSIVEVVYRNDKRISIINSRLGIKDEKRDDD